MGTADLCKTSTFTEAIPDSASQATESIRLTCRVLHKTETASINYNITYLCQSILIPYTHFIFPNKFREILREGLEPSPRRTGS